MKVNCKLCMSHNTQVDIFKLYAIIYKNNSEKIVYLEEISGMERGRTMIGFRRDVLSIMKWVNRATSQSIMNKYGSKIEECVELIDVKSEMDAEYDKYKSNKDKIFELEL